MRTCNACQHELDQAAIVQGTCPHCGAILRKLSQRTFDNKRLPGQKDNAQTTDEEFNLDKFLELGQTDTDHGGQTIEVSDVTLGDDEPAVDVEDMTPLEDEQHLRDLAADVQARDEADEFLLGDSLDLELVETHPTIEISDVVLDADEPALDIEDMTPLDEERGHVELVDDLSGGGPNDYFGDESFNLGTSDTSHVGATIEINGHDHDDEPKVDEEDSTPLEEVAAEEKKSPTVDDRTDMTMVFSALPGAAKPDEPKPTKRSTHTFEADRTIDLSMSPAEAKLLDSQWRGTLDLGTKQGQTIRQKETITGFRSSLPVKSRYVREKRKGPVCCQGR